VEYFSGVLGKPEDFSKVVQNRMHVFFLRSRGAGEKKGLGPFYYQPVKEITRENKVRKIVPEST
jgi:hypothetical protein